MSLRIVDGDSAPCADEHVGETQVQGTSLMLEYADLADQPFFRDG